MAAPTGEGLGAVLRAEVYVLVPDHTLFWSLSLCQVAGASGVAFVGSGTAENIGCVKAAVSRCHHKSWSWLETFKSMTWTLARSSHVQDASNVAG